MRAHRMDGPDDLSAKVAQLLFVRMGSNMDPPIRAHDEFDRVSGILRRVPLGGLLLFNGVYGETRKALAELQKVCRYPLVVAADMERGAGQQLQGATVFPHAMALSVRGSEAEADAREVGRITAVEALSEGVTYVLGPVADVNRNPRNPIIGARAFGSDPKVAATLVRAYIEGCRSAGALVSPKHFPGHGNTAADSHSEVPRIEGSLSELDRSDLVPFHAAVEAGADTVMTAHATYPGLDPSGTVATASPVILRDVLRHHLGFSGAIVTDSLLMAGVRQNYANSGQMAVELINAGQDILLDVDDAEAVVDAVLAAVVEGRLARSTVDSAFERVWRLKTRLAEIHGPRWHIDPPPGPTDAMIEEHRKVARSVARRALVASGSTNATRPPRKFVMVKPYRTHLDPEIEPLGRLVTQSLGTEAYNQIGDDTSDQELAALEQECKSIEALVISIAVRPAAWRRFGLSDRLVAAVERLIELADWSMLVVLGSPDALRNLKYSGPMVYTCSDVEASQKAVYDYIMKE